MSQNFGRQIGIIDIQSFQENNVAIIGCGAIGSYVASSLAKMGLTNFYLWDFDKVEVHNLPNQFFREKDLGRFKVEVTKENMIEFNKDVNIGVLKEKFGKKTSLKTIPIVISCVDDMDVRKQTFENCKRDKVQLFIDCRMGGLQGQVYSIDMTNKKEVKNYETTLFSNADAAPIRCTEKSIIFTVLGIASIVCNQIVKALKGERVKNFILLDYITPQMF